MTLTSDSGVVSPDATPDLDAVRAAFEADTAKTAKRDRFVRSLAPAAMFVLLIGVWYFISYVRMDEVRRRTALPPPHKVLTEGFFVWEARRGLRPILEALLVTGRVALIGFAISILLGVLVAILMNTARWVENSVFPYAVVLQVTPILALVPLIRNWFGFGIPSRVVVCVLIAVFPVITNTLFGLQSAQKSHHDLFSLHGVGRHRPTDRQLSEGHPDPRAVDRHDLRLRLRDHHFLDRGLDLESIAAQLARLGARPPMTALS